MAWLPLISASLETVLDSLLLLQSYSQPVGVLCFFGQHPDLPTLTEAGLWLYSTPFSSDDKQVFGLACLGDDHPDLESLGLLASSQVVDVASDRVEARLKDVLLVKHSSETAPAPLSSSNRQT